MSKKVVLVGHCGPDSSFLRMAVSSASRGITVAAADDDQDLQAHLTAGVDLLLLNRELGWGFDQTEGVEVIRTLRVKHPNLKMMLVSNYPEAQAAAVQAGALPGFGKREIGSARVTQLLREVIADGVSTPAELKLLRLQHDGPSRVGVYPFARMEQALGAEALGVGDSASVRSATLSGALVMLTASVVVLGAALLLELYFDRTAYWHDEASLVFNIFQKPVAQLLGPLDFAQAAPPAFLALERGMYLLLGRSELAMRLPPLVAAIFGLAMFALLARRFFADAAPRIALLLIVLWACSERLIWHAAEAKQYSFDVLAALAIVGIALQEVRSRNGRLIACCVIAAVAIWFSYSTAFVFGGVSVALLPMSRSRRDWLTWLTCNALFAVSFLAVYFVCVRHQQVGELYAYWARDFLDLSRPWLIPGWLVRRLASIANYPLDLGGPVLLPLSVIGAVWLWKQRRRQTLAVLAAPIGLVLAASAFHQYPFTGNRLTLFVAPCVFILAGLGLMGIVQLGHRSRHWTRLAGCFVIYLLALGFYHAGRMLVRPPIYGDMPAAVRYAAARDADGDVVYSNKISEFKCYWPDRPVHDVNELPQSKPAGRFWLVLSYRADKTDRTVEPLLAQVRPHATQVDTFTAPGAAAILFDTKR